MFRYVFHPVAMGSGYFNFEDVEKLENTGRTDRAGFVYGVIALLWMGLIFYLSSQPAPVSDGLSKGFLRALLEQLALITSADFDLKFWHLLLRKAAHAFLYAVLGVWLALYLHKTRQLTGGRLLRLVVLLCLLYALSDEWHQALVPGRSGEVRDVLIDTVGAGVGTALWQRFYFRKK